MTTGDKPDHIANVFLSCSLRSEDKSFIEFIEKILKEYKISTFGTVGKYSAAPTNIAELMKKNIPLADFVVVVATPRYFQKDVKSERIDLGTSEMLHVESGMAFMAGKPLVVFVQEGTNVGTFIPAVTQYITLNGTQSDLEGKSELIRVLLNNTCEIVQQLKEQENNKAFFNELTNDLSVIGGLKKLVESLGNKGQHIGNRADLKSYPNLNCIWLDEFDEDTLNHNNWSFQIGNNRSANQLQIYTKKNVTVKNGYLVIEARKKRIFKTRFTSSCIHTKGKFYFKYGRVDVRAKLPNGKGIWAAIWMIGKDVEHMGWPICGEMSIVEKIGGDGKENTVFGGAHWPKSFGILDQSGGHYSLPSGFFCDKFHVFSVLWSPKEIIWYVDNIKYHEMKIETSTMSAFNEEFHLFIQLAVGGNFPGKPDQTTTFPQRLIIDYIRVFQ